MLNIYKYYDDYESLPGLESYKKQVLQSPSTAYQFTQDVIKGRWSELEPKLKKEGGMPWIMYANQFNIEV